MEGKHLNEEIINWNSRGETPEERISYLSSLKVLIDKEAKLDYAEYKGFQKGLELGRAEAREQAIEEGREQGLEQGKKEFLNQIILKMIANGSDNEAIQALTDVSLEEIEALRQQR